MPKINIMTQLLAFFMLAIALNLLNFKSLLIAAVLIFFALTLTKNHQFYRLTKRLKWFYLVMFLVFALNTPGEHLAAWPFELSPTYEGLLAGFMQLLRITVMLAVLSILLAVNSKQQLISGFYFLLFPLKYIGLDIERFAARLWLTLHYVELQQEKPKNPHFFNHLAQNLAVIFSETQHEEMTIRLEKPVFRWLDIALLVLLIALLIEIVAS